MNYCPNCGFALDAGCRFCGNCGCSIQQVHVSYESYSPDPIRLVIAHGITPEIKVPTRLKASYDDDSPFSIEEAIRIVNNAIKLIGEFKAADPENRSYKIISKGLVSLSDRLTSGETSPISTAEAHIMLLAANLFYQATGILSEEADDNRYETTIIAWSSAVNNISNLLLNGIIQDNIVDESSEGIQSEDVDKDEVAGESDEWQKKIDEEIESLEKELERLCPKFKIQEYIPEHDYWKDLDGLTGLNNVKKQLQEHISAFNVHKVRKEMHPDLKTDFKFNCIFKGRPGTGKTTVARILSGILKQEGMLKKGQCVEVDTSSITVGWVGFTSKFTRLAALKAVGGVLFIDEAYSLVTGAGGSDTQGNEAIDALTPIMTNYAEDLIVVLAGYEEEMNNFMSKVNTGLASRFQKNVDFEDYSGEEMLEIFISIAKSNCFELEKRAIQRLKKLLCAIASRKDENRAFANARTVRSVFDLVRNRAAQRYLKDTSVNPDLIIADDITLSAEELKSIGAI